MRRVGPVKFLGKQTEQLFVTLQRSLFFRTLSGNGQVSLLFIPTISLWEQNKQVRYLIRFHHNTVFFLE